MTLEPLLSATPAIQIHTGAAFAALGLGAVQLRLPKGDPRHRLMGWAWVVLMALVAASSLMIHELRVWGPWSPIHLLSLWVLCVLPFGVHAARRHQVTRHGRTMRQLFLFALVLAGLFTLWPGRILHAVFFGP